MKKFLVTGATGFLGRYVVEALAARKDCEVRALARSVNATPDLPGVERVRGDILSGPELADAMKGVDGVFHLAGFVSRDPDAKRKMMEVHVDGTRRVLRTAKDAGVSRVVVASSSGTVAVSKDEIIHDEKSGYATDVAARWAYYASKIFQEKVAFELADKLGIEVVCVNPSLLLGPGDSRLSSTKDVLRVMRGQVPMVVRGGINFVDARDAAEATVAAMDKGKPGERYLLGGPNWTVKEFFERIARAARVSPPRVMVPGAVSRWGASLVEGLYRARGSEPPIDRTSVEMAEHYWYVDSSKAARELGFDPREPGLTLADTVKYLRQTIADL